MTQLANQITPPGVPAPGLQGRAYPPIIQGAGAITIITTPTTVTVSASQLALTLVPASGSFNAASNTAILVDCTGAPATGTLPPSPTPGDVILFYKFGTNQFTIALNSLLWYGTSSNPTTTNEGWESIVYTGASRGWIDQ